jgi:hypothetical protein
LRIWRSTKSSKTTPLPQASRRCRWDGAEAGRPYCTRRRHHHLSAAPTNLDPKNKERSPQNRGGALPPTRAEIHRVSMAQRPQSRGDQRWRRRDAGGRDPIACRLSSVLGDFGVIGC